MTAYDFFPLFKSHLAKKQTFLQKHVLITPPTQCNYGSTVKTGFFLHISCKLVPKSFLVCCKYMQNQNMGFHFGNQGYLEENIHKQILGLGGTTLKKIP